VDRSPISSRSSSIEYISDPTNGYCRTSATNPARTGLFRTYRATTTGILLGGLDEASTVRDIRNSLDEQMQVVRHETVGKECKLLPGGRSRNLRQHRTYSLCVLEERLAVVGAKGQEVSVQSDVVECLQLTRLVGTHAGREARVVPRRITSPPEGGHYVLVLLLRTRVATCPQCARRWSSSSGKRVRRRHGTRRPRRVTSRRTTCRAG
jgi:hypothetical protein